ncbi:glycoside hydrolase family 79 protein [Jaapia argillacea MUCL 33604]|uniref:Glycoside hydrolase family 79 protein n=1 Tax=Jaapia argillacea MUCL 33604 TaxID=933084 RepID=A0A067PEC7_9AGAM|nr:glycoside hydrolase family 79 protein [Jaapia argillacea MUCL 33604]
MFSLIIAPLVYLAVHQTTSASAFYVPVPVVAPAGAPIISPSLISFSIEQDRWPEWVGTTTPNQYFYNLLDNLNILSGSYPWIRIGANSEDHTKYDPSVEYNVDITPAVTPTVPYPEATNITVGPAYYTLAANLPPSTHVWWGVNLGQYNLSSAYYESMAMMSAFASPAITSKGITLDFIEVGNEADLYSSNGARNSSWNPAEYVSEWTQFAGNVSAANNLYSLTNPKLIGGAFANSAYNASGFSPEAIFDLGILDTAPGSLIRTISQHHYSGSFCAGSASALQDLMDKATIRSNLSAFIGDIETVKGYGLDYVFGETNSYACHGAPNVSNTAGAALWALDYSLYAGTIGASRLFFHEGIGYKYNFIQPVTLNTSILDGTPLATPLPPHIQPQYYSAVIAAEAIGRSGNTQMVEISIPDQPYLAGYTFYVDGALERAILINSESYISTEAGTPRTELSVSFNFTGPATAGRPSFMDIKRLNITYADDTSGVTWGGQTYETPDGRVSGPVSLETLTAGQAVSIQETEVVMVSFR